MIEDLDPEVYAQQMRELLAVHGPKGEELSRRMSTTMEGSSPMDMMVAMNLIRCYLEDNSPQDRAHYALANQTVYTYIRHQIDVSKGVNSTYGTGAMQ